VKRLLIAVLISSLCAVGLAAPLKHTERLEVGGLKLTVGFTEWPLQAERSLDMTFASEGGIAGKSVLARFVKPDGTTWGNAEPLPRFPRDRTVWGFDSAALPLEGQWKLELSTGNQKAVLPLTVLERPVGPPGNLITALAMVPILAVFVLAIRAWLRVKPLRQLESRSW
jgi:hypothetical protein